MIKEEIMNNDEKHEESFEEPKIEDFLSEEIDEKEELRKRKRRQLLIKGGIVLIVVVLLANVFNFLLNIYSLDAIRFIKKSEQLSEQEMIQEWKEAVVTIHGNNRKGTGFVIRSDGYILSNYHVVENMFPIMISFDSGDRYEGTIIEYNEENDLALLKIDGADLSYLPLSDEKVTINEKIFVIGNPLLHTQIATDGYIIDHVAPYDVLKISAPIYPGNSGSPVINEKGEVVGVVYAKTIPSFKNNEETVGLAVPIDLVYQSIDSLTEILQR